MDLKLVVPSHSDPRKRYTLTRHAKDGSWSCTCPAWRFQHADAAHRSCRHIRAIALDLQAHVERSAARV